MQTFRKEPTIAPVRNAASKNMPLIITPVAVCALLSQIGFQRSRKEDESLLCAPPEFATLFAYRHDFKLEIRSPTPYDPNHALHGTLLGSHPSRRLRINGRQLRP